MKNKLLSSSFAKNAHSAYPPLFGGKMLHGVCTVLLLLCVSMAGWATAVDTYLGYDGGLETYADTYKWYSLDGATAPNEVVSIQQPADGWDGLVECGIFVNVGTDYNGVKFDGVAVTLADYCYKQGTGGILYISKFTKKCTTVEFTNDGTVVRGLRIQNDKGTGDACETSGGSDPDPDPTPSVSPYCDTEVKHQNLENAAADSHVLLSIGSDGHGHTIVNLKPTASNAVTFDYINIVGQKEIGQDVTSGGYDEMAIIFNTPTPNGEGNITFTVQWSYPNWTGRYECNVTLPANATCASADPFPGDNVYCDYTDNSLRANNGNVTLTWETNGDGDVVITLKDGEGASNTHFRNEGFEYGNGKTMDDCWFVYSGMKHATCELASKYFTVEQAVNNGNTYALRKKDGETVPNGAVISFQGHAFSWKQTGADGAYTLNKYFAYDYGYNCPSLDVPTGVAVTDAGVITFTGSVEAESYTAFVYLDGILKHRQTVTSGATLTYVPYTTGTYQVKVTASAEGYPTTDPSEPANWNLTATPVVVGNSDYCEAALPRHSDKDANFSWETDNSGNMTITLIPLSGQTATFRSQGMKLADFTVGSNRTAASEYFDRVYSEGGTTVVLNLKNASIKPGQGEPIYFNGVVEYTVDGVGPWPTANLTYAYGSKCTGQKRVTVSANNAEWGTATVNDAASVDVEPEATVTCVATPASGYEFVNWTKGGVEVSTSATYVATITETTNLVANFDYIRNTYCHYELLSNESAVQGKKLYMTVGAIGGGDYRIMYEGSAEAPFTGLQNANYKINQVTAKTDVEGQVKTGQDVPFTNVNGRWNFSAEGYGKAWIEFSLAEGKTIDDIFVWENAIYFNTESGELGYVDNKDRLGLFGNPAPKQHNIDWNSTCSDAEAPVFVKAEAEVLNESSVRLKIKATDNWEGPLTYTIARADASDIILNGASGEEVTQDVTGLTAGTEYTFTVTVSDGVNNANRNIVVTPVADNEKPVMGAASLESKTWNNAIINVAATDNKGVTAYRVVNTDPAIDAEYVASEGKITVEGLTAATDYTFTIKAKDAAGNISDESAVVSFTTDNHYTAPQAACAAPTWEAELVKALYSPTYSANYTHQDWGSGTVATEDEFGRKYVTNGSGYFGADGFSLNCILMEKLHYDIWVENDATIRIVPICRNAADTGNEPEIGANVNLVGQQWNSIDLTLASDYAAVTNWSKVHQVKIDNAANLTIWIANAYFYRETAYVDTEVPTNASANKVTEGFYSVTINAQAEDNSGAVSFIVKDGDVEVATGAAASGVATTITVNNLTPGTVYNFNVIVADETGNALEPIAIAATTKAFPAAAPAPDFNGKLVIPVFTDAMAGAPAEIHSGGWGEATIHEWLNISANDKVFYVRNLNWAGWHSWGGDIDATGMQYLHVDVYSLGATSVNVTPISHDPTREGSSTIALTPNAWTSYDVPLSNYDAANIEWNKIFQFKFMNPVGGNELMIDNVYFWREPSYIRNDSWMAPGELGTICYPEGLVAVGAKMYEMAGTDENGKFVFDEVNEMEPGVPYLFEATSNAIQFYTTAATPATEAGTSNGLVGTFEDIVIPQASPNIYYFSGTKFYAVTARQTDLAVPANRAYVDLTTPHPASAPRHGVRRITFNVEGAQVITGMESIQPSEISIQKVLINGQLFILRGEKMYNANGQLVR